MSSSSWPATRADLLPNGKPGDHPYTDSVGWEVDEGPYLGTSPADFPNLTIIAAHPGWPWTDEMTAVALHKGNVFWELSGWAPKYFPAPLKVDIRRTRSAFSDCNVGLLTSPWNSGGARQIDARPR